eukprot:1159715-Pelagomonas_calceolata.AAC.9
MGLRVGFQGAAQGQSKAMQWAQRCECACTTATECAAGPPHNKHPPIQLHFAVQTSSKRPSIP